MIVDAFQNPYLASDLATFDQGFGLPAADFTNTVMPGTPAFDPNDDNQVGWGEESTLDVLWAHAIAPGAKIRLISAASNNDTDILAATQYVVDNDLGDVLSQSFGENENCVDPALLTPSTRCSPRPRRRAGRSSPPPATPEPPSSPATAPVRSRSPAVPRPTRW